MILETVFMMELIDVNYHEVKDLAVFLLYSYKFKKEETKKELEIIISSLIPTGLPVGLSNNPE